MYVSKNEVNLIESNGVKPKAQVEKSNGDAIEDAKEHHGLHVNGFTFKKIEALCGMKGAKCHH